MRSESEVMALAVPIMKMDEPSADAFLAKHNFTVAERALVWGSVGVLKITPALAQTTSSPPTRTSPVDRLWTPSTSIRAALWLLGASHRRLSRIEGVNESTIWKTISRVLPDAAERSRIRLATNATDEAIAYWRNLAYSNTHELRNLSPLEIANWLRSHPMDSD